MLLKSLLALALLSTSLATSVLPREASSLDPPLSLAQANQKQSRSPTIDNINVSPAPGLKMTNAERMIAGLPLLPPKRRASGISHAARAAASGLTTNGFIAVRDSTTSSPLGFISSTYNSLGEARLTSPTNPVALSVILPESPTDTLGPVSLAQSAPPNAAYPWLGGIVGYVTSSSNLASGSSNYLYLGGVKESAPNATPQSESNSFSDARGVARNTESAIWYYNPGTLGLSVMWVNTDGSMTAGYPFYDSTGDFLGVAGDKDAFAARFPTERIQFVDLYFVLTS